MFEVDFTKKVQLLFEVVFSRDAGLPGGTFLYRLRKFGLWERIQK